MRRFAPAILVLLAPSVARAQERDVVITGGWIFAATGNDRVRNPGIVIRGGKLLRVGGDMSFAAADAEVIRLADEETIIPGMFDLHAHYAVVNGARALGVGDRLGSIETGKWADLVVLRGNPLTDIRRTRDPRIVIKAGRVYDPAALAKSVEGKLGPATAADTTAWLGAPTRSPQQ